MDARTARRRFETWLVWGVGFVGLFAMVPIGRLLADGPYRSLVDQRSVDQMRGAVEAGAGGTSPVAAGLFLLPPVLGVGGFLVARALRARASRRYVVSAAATGSYDPVRSPSHAWTAAGWALLTVGLGAALGVGMLVPQAEMDAEAAHLYALVGTWRGVVLGLGAFVLAVVVQAWVHRRRHEVGPLLASGVLARTSAPEVAPARGWRAFGKGLHAFLANLWISGLFLLAGWGQAALDREATAPSDMAFDAVVNIIAFPAAVAMGLVVVLWLSPLRWVVRACLADPSSRIALGLFFGGSVAGFFTGHWIATIPTVVGLCVLAVTGLRMMDLGPQPWLGIMFLAMSWWFGASYDPAERDNAVPLVPGGVLGWAAAVLALALALRDVWKQWQEAYGTRRVTPTSEPVV